MRKIIAGAALALLAASAGGTAFAGEITPNGDRTGAYTNSNSECAFSGLEDYDLEQLPTPGVTQNWGQIPSAERTFLRSIGVSPGALCNGHLAGRK
jgi:hypothetical protein